jgi:hypothetical protein
LNVSNSFEYINQNKLKAVLSVTALALDVSDGITPAFCRPIIATFEK